MPWNGSAPSQTFGRTDGTYTGDDVFAQEAANNVNIEATNLDTHATDLKDGIDACLKKDGGNTASADIPMGGFTLTNIAAAGARTEPARFSDVQDNLGQYVATVGGTADAITLTPSIAITAYAAGQRFSFIASGDNTGAATVAVSGIAGAKDIKRNDGANTALSAGDIQSGAIVDIEYDGTRFLLLSVNSAATVGGLLAASNLSDVASASTSRSNLGLGTIATQASNNVSITGGAISGITDLAVADGGTGASSAANARTNLGVAYASQANMEALAATAVVIPSVQHFHPGHPKAGGNLDASGTPAFLSGDYGMGAVTDNGTGLMSMAFDTAFNDTNYWMVGGGCKSDAANTQGHISMRSTDAKTASAFDIQIRNSSNTLIDSTEIGLAFFGDYA